MADQQSITGGRNLKRSLRYRGKHRLYTIESIRKMTTLLRPLVHTMLPTRFDRLSCCCEVTNPNGWRQWQDLKNTALSGEHISRCICPSSVFNQPSTFNIRATVRAPHVHWGKPAADAREVQRYRIHDASSESSSSYPEPALTARDGRVHESCATLRLCIQQCPSVMRTGPVYYRTSTSGKSKTSASIGSSGGC